jgi:hypothetical protein
MMLWQWLRLRYRLQWASVRRSPRRAAAFALSQLFVAGAVSATAASTAALVDLAASLGRLSTVTGVVLTAWFFNAVVISVMLGFGLSDTFSDRALRRYPLSRAGRLAVRHGLALLEPLWLVTAVLAFVCAVSASPAAIPSRAVALTGAIMLVVVNYLFAASVVAIVGRLAASRLGFAALMLAAAAAVPASMVVGELGERATSGVQLVLGYSPPMLAAALLTGASPTPVGLLWLLAWLAALCLAVFFAEQRGAAERRRQSTPAWPGWPERLSARLPGPASPELARSLRAYLRDPRVQVSAVLALPIAAGLILKQAPEVQSGAALLFLPWTGTFVTGGHALNALGADGGGFRRVLLAPVPVVALIRAAAYAPLILSSVVSALAVAAWIVLGPVPATSPLVAMLLGQAFVVTLAFHAVALLAAVLAPKRLGQRRSLRLELSAGGQVGFALGLAVVLVAPIVVRHTLLAGRLDAWWWTPWAALPLAIGAHEGAVRLAGVVVAGRREAIARLLLTPTSAR